MNQRFRPEERLHRRSDFKRVYEKGRRLSVAGLTMWFCRPTGEAVSRLGLAVPKSYGNAVARNRLKRLLREAFRLNKSKLPPGIDMVFSARSSLGKPRYQTIEPLVLKLWTLAKLPPPSPAS